MNEDLKNCCSITDEKIKMLEEKFEMISLDDVLEFTNTKIFENNKHKMLITFDDGLSDHYNAAKILNQFDIQATFFIPTCIMKEIELVVKKKLTPLEMVC